MDTDYAVAPGEYLQEWLDENSESQGRLASRLGVSRKFVNDLVNGRARLSDEMAIRLGRATGIPANSWIRFESGYRADLARLADEKTLGEHAAKIPDETCTYLRKRGYITCTRQKPGELVGEFLAYHGFGTWAAYEDETSSMWSGEYALAALKETRSAEVDRVTLSTWLRAGEMTEAFELGRTATYSEAELIGLLPELRERTSRPDGQMLGDLTRMLRKVGVVFVVVEPPAKFPLHGITRWLAHSVPMIQQTGRRQTDGFITWTLFHELGHVMKDPRGELHLEYNKSQRNTVAERGANAFAREVLFDAEGIERVRGLTSDSAIRSAAAALGVSPGLIVHHLHRTRQLSYSHGNQLCVDLADSYST